MSRPKSLKHITLIFMLVLLSALVMAQTLAQDVSSVNADGTRTYVAPDLASFTYPLDKYSIRRDGFCIAPDRMQTITFPGIIRVEPNDSFIYGGEAGNVYRITFAAIANDHQITADGLYNLLGTLPLAQYGPDALRGAQIRNLEIDGLPAIRVDGIATGPQGIEAHIIAVSDTQIFEIVIEPVVLLQTLVADEEMLAERRGIYEAILASIQWSATR